MDLYTDYCPILSYVSPRIRISIDRNEIYCEVFPNACLELCDAAVSFSVVACI